MWGKSAPCLGAHCRRGPPGTAWSGARPRQRRLAGCAGTARSASATSLWAHRGSGACEGLGQALRYREGPACYTDGSGPYLCYRSKPAFLADGTTYISLFGCHQLFVAVRYPPPVLLLHASAAMTWSLNPKIPKLNHHPEPCHDTTDKSVYAMELG